MKCLPKLKPVHRKNYKNRRTVHNKQCITVDIRLPAQCNVSQSVLPGNHAARCTESPSGLLAVAVVFQRLQGKISHEAVGEHTRS